jgi:hypothetical protein
LISNIDNLVKQSGGQAMTDSSRRAFTGLVIGGRQKAAESGDEAALTALDAAAVLAEPARLGAPQSIR